MTPASLWRVIQAFQVADVVSLRPFESSTLLTAFDDASILQVVLPERLEAVEFRVSVIDHLKALHKRFKRQDSIPWELVSEYSRAYQEPSRPLSDVMTQTMEHRTGSFQIDFKRLERIYKSLKCKSSVIRIDTTDLERIVITNEHGDIGFLATWRD